MQCNDDTIERLNVDQLKQLCKAAKLRHVGKKQELVDRLLDSPITSKYGPEGKYASLNVDNIKNMCRERTFRLRDPSLTSSFVSFITTTAPPPRVPP